MLPLCEQLHTLKLKDCFIHDAGFIAIMEGIWGTHEQIVREDNEARDPSFATLLDTGNTNTNRSRSNSSSSVASSTSPGKSTHPHPHKPYRERTTLGKQPRTWKLVNLSNNRVTYDGIVLLYTLIHANTKVFTKQKKRQARHARTQGTRKATTHTADDEEEEGYRGLGWYNTTQESADCYDQYRSVVQQFHLVNNALNAKGAKLLGLLLAHEGSFIRQLYLDALLDRKHEQGFLDINHIKYATDVNMNGQGIGLLSIATATQLLKANKNVVRIAVRGNHLSTEAAALFTQGMGSCKAPATSGMALSLRQLDFSYNLITLKNLKFSGSFFRGLYKLNTLHTLVLDSNDMKDDALWGVASFLASNPSIRTLSLRDQDFKRRATMENLYQNLKFNNKLTVLDLRYNPAVLNEYIFTAESYGLVSSELEENNPGLRVLPFHEDSACVALEQRRRIPHRKDLYPKVFRETKSVFEYDDYFLQQDARVVRNEKKLKEKGGLHVRYSKKETFVV